MSKYTHDYDIRFVVNSDESNGEDLKGKHIRAAILKRLSALDDEEILEAVGMPINTIDNT